LVSRYAQQHGVPERLIHRVIMRESRYNPGVVAKGNYGLMQIRLGTARGMGYRGGPQGLLDPDVNMRHAVPYLANAYRVARGNEDLAVRYYAGGYYYAAKRQGMLGQMRSAASGAAVAPAAEVAIKGDAAQGRGDAAGRDQASAAPPAGRRDASQTRATETSAPGKTKLAARRSRADASPVPPTRPADIVDPEPPAAAPTSAPLTPDIVRD
jgi:hypothetical protein